MTDMLVVAMVGLPARGKTHVATKLARYLRWLSVPTRVFNVGDYRRARLGGLEKADFFRSDNDEARATRRKLALEALDDTFDWLSTHGGRVAIYDATNTTRARRDLIVDRCRSEGVPLMFVEVIIEDPEVVRDNIRDTKLRSPDYTNLAPEEAEHDFRARLSNYEAAYEPIGRDDATYIKRIDGGRQVMMNRVSGRLQLRIATYLSGMQSMPQPVWLVRHGESMFNVEGLLGGDAPLSARGRRFSAELAEFVRGELHELSGLEVWTSSLRRTIETAHYLERPTLEWRELDEINAGTCEGMTYERIAAELPDEYEARKHDKFRYRYPRGESYEEMIQRLDRVVVELERQTSPVLIVGHQAVLRALYSYLRGTPPKDCPYLEIPLHTLIRLTPDLATLEENRVIFDV